MKLGELHDEILDTPKEQDEYEVVIPIDDDYYNLHQLRYDHAGKRVILEW